MSQLHPGGYDPQTGLPVAQPDPNACKGCGTPAVEPGYQIPICARCRTGLAARPVPAWIVGTGVLILIVMFVSLARFPAAYSAAVAFERGRKAEKAGNYSRA